MFRLLFPIISAGCFLTNSHLSHSAEASFVTSNYGNGVFLHVEFSQIGDYFSVENGSEEFLKDAGTGEAHRFIFYVDRSRKVFYFVGGCNGGSRIIDVVQNKQGVAAATDGTTSQSSIDCRFKNNAYPKTVSNIIFSFNLVDKKASVILLNNSFATMKFIGADGKLENSGTDLTLDIWDIKLNFDDGFLGTSLGYCTVASVNSVSTSSNENQYFKSGTKTHERHGFRTAVKRLYSQIQCKYAKRFDDL